MYLTTIWVFRVRVRVRARVRVRVKAWNGVYLTSIWVLHDAVKHVSREYFRPHVPIVLGIVPPCKMSKRRLCIVTARACARARVHHEEKAAHRVRTNHKKQRDKATQ